MEILFFNGYAEIGEHMYKKANDGCNITATLFLEDAIGLMKDLMSYEDIEIGGVNVAKTEYNGYSKEYYVTLSEDLVLDVEPAWNDKCYLSAEPDIMLIDGNANSAIIKDIPHSQCREIYIGESPSEEYAYDEELLNSILDKAKIVTDDDDIPVGIAFNINDILKYLFE